MRPAQGEAEADAAPPSGSGPDEAPASAGTGWLGGLQTLVVSVLGLLGDGLELLSLELQRAWQVLQRLLWLLLLAWAALLTAWLAFWVGLAVVLAEAGLSVPLACAVVVLANAGVLALCLSQARLLRSLLTWESLRRQLVPSPGSGEPDERPGMQQDWRQETAQGTGQGRSTP